MHKRQVESNWVQREGHYRRFGICPNNECVQGGRSKRHTKQIVAEVLQNTQSNGKHRESKNRPKP
jgi:hypothetical protein